MNDATPQLVNEDFVRTWKLSSVPEFDPDTKAFRATDQVSVTVKRKSGGLLSNVLHDKAHKLIAHRLPVTIKGTGSGFSCFTQAPDGAVPTVQPMMLWIAGGVGITPFMSKWDGIVQIAKANPDHMATDIVLLFAGRDDDISALHHFRSPQVALYDHVKLRIVAFQTAGRSPAEASSARDSLRESSPDTALNIKGRRIGIIAAVTLLSVVLLQTCARKLPVFLLALMIGVGLCIALNGKARGVAMVGSVNAALPAFAPPSLQASDVAHLLPGALAVALVGLLEAISIGRSFAIRRKEKFDANQEMIGQGLSNSIGGFFQCYAGSGSFTRSGVNAEAGAVTPLSGILSSILLAGGLLLFVDYIRYIPVPAMAGFILYVAWRLVDFSELRRVIHTSRPETMILVATLLAGLLVELDFAIYVGVIASFAAFIYESSHPAIRVSAPIAIASGRRKFRNSDMHDIPECHQIMAIRLDGPLYFGSVEHVEHEFEKKRRKRAGQKHVIFYLKGVGKVDLAGADFLIHAIRAVRADGGSFHIVALFPPLLQSLRRFHVIEEIGGDHLHISKGDALAATIQQIDNNVCEGCTKRVFLECAGLPARWIAKCSSKLKEKPTEIPCGVTHRNRRMRQWHGNFARQLFHIGAHAQLDSVGDQRGSSRFV